MKKALVLFAHGARDPNWTKPFERLHQLVSAQLPETTVALAFLELMSPKLPELVAQLVQDGCNEVTVIPVFLGQGGHVLRDLPPMITQLREQYPAVTLRVAEAVGENAGVLAAIAGYCIDMHQDAG